MLIAVVQKTTLAELETAINAVDTTLYQALELRLDACEDLDPQRLANIPLPLPAIFTLRCKEQGGSYSYDEEKRLQMIAELLHLHPAYMDLEDSIPADRIKELGTISPQTRIIISHHNFSETPENLQHILDTMRALCPGAIYKIACNSRSTLDALRMMAFCIENGKRDIVAIGMGEHGVTTRILAPVIHSGFCYCPVQERSAPGQIAAATLQEVYNFKKLSYKTAIYGLLGDPVDQSVGHLFHNERNTNAHVDAVYVKWRITKKELPDALTLLKKIGVQGLSITMPLKQTVLPYVDIVGHAAQQVEAANTLRATTQGCEATNTDGPAAVANLEVPVRDKRVVVLGAGGASMAVIHALYQETPHITVYNRSTDKRLPCPVLLKPLTALNELVENGYDIIINTLPFDIPFPFTDIPFITGTIAMDISYGKPSTFLAVAAQHGCRTIDGSGMFTRQALLQRDFWGLPA